MAPEMILRMIQRLAFLVFMIFSFCSLSWGSFLIPAYATEVSAKPAEKTYSRVRFTAEVAGVETLAQPVAWQSITPPPKPKQVWWRMPAILFVFTFFLGIVAVAAGVGGGVLFVPIVGGFFPINIDFVRGAGLMVALSGALFAGPGLLKKHMANLRLAIPVALAASISSILGARVGLVLPENVIQIALGSAIVGIAIVILLARGAERPEVKEDRIANWLRIRGSYTEESTGHEVEWRVHRVLPGLLLFVVIGFMAGMFGLGAGWANVPALNLVMGAPLKVAVGTSVFILSLTDTTAAWVYLNEGAVLPLVAVPSMAGMMMGTRIGVKLLAKSKPVIIKRIVIGFLIVAGLRALLRGFGI